MPNNLAPGSNTLANLLAMAEGHMLDLKIMPLGGGEFSITIIPTPVKGLQEAKALPPLRGKIKADEDIDIVVSEDVALLFVGELAPEVERVAAYRKQLLDSEKATPTPKIEKPGDKMPPPTGRKEPAKKGPATPPAGPPTPAATPPAPPAEGLFAQPAPAAPADELVADAQVIEEPSYDF